MLGFRTSKRNNETLIDQNKTTETDHFVVHLSRPFVSRSCGSIKMKFISNILSHNRLEHKKNKLMCQRNQKDMNDMRYYYILYEMTTGYFLRTYNYEIWRKLGNYIINKGNNPKRKSCRNFIEKNNTKL